MDNRFTIGEMARLHQMSIKTLRYYDQIDLFKPAEVDPLTGYRYYEGEQFEHLDTINYLKELGFSLKEIKQHLEQRDRESFIRLLQRQKELTRAKIASLQQVLKRFDHRIADLQAATEISQLDSPRVKTYPRRQIVRLAEQITEGSLEVALRRLQNLAALSSAVFIGGVGLTVSQGNLLAGNFQKYNSIFILLEEAVKEGTLVTDFPAGEYGVIYYNGDHQASTARYQKLLEYLANNGYQVAGDGIERTIIDHYISGSYGDYLTELQIPIKRQ